MGKSRRRKFIILIVPLSFLLFLMLSFFLDLDPQTTDVKKAFLHGDSFFSLGFDDLGRDIFSRLLIAIRITLLIAVSTALLSGLIGTLLGTLAGYFEGWLDKIISQIINITLAFPTLLLAIGVTLFLPAGISSIVIAISLTGWAGIARLIRAHVMVVKKNDFITAAKVLGSAPYKIVLKHIFPNTVPLIIVSVSLKLGSFILAESGLSFLGLGVPPPSPTLGGMVADGRDFLFTAPHIPFIPGLAAGLLVLAVNVWGEAVEEELNPKTQ